MQLQRAALIPAAGGRATSGKALGARSKLNELLGVRCCPADVADGAGALPASCFKSTAGEQPRVGDKPSVLSNQKHFQLSLGYALALQANKTRACGPLPPPSLLYGGAKDSQEALSRVSRLL